MLVSIILLFILEGLPLAFILSRYFSQLLFFSVKVLTFPFFLKETCLVSVKPQNGYT